MKIIDATDQKKWDKFITSHEDANFLQSWAWGDFHEARGKGICGGREREDTEETALYA